MSNVQDFTKGKIGKAIIMFYFPMFVTNMLQQFYTFADTAIVGNGLGDNALAAVGNMASLTFLIIGFSVGLSIGFSTLVAQHFGAKNEKKLKEAIASSIELAVVITVVLTLLSNLFLKRALIILRTDSAIINDSLVYGRIIFGGLFSAIAYNLSSAILRAFGDSKTPLKAIVFSSVLNIALDYFLIYIVGTGVEGAAFATVFSQVVSSFICIKKITTIEYAKLSQSDFKFDIETYLRLLKNGVPMAIMNSITAVGCMVVQYFVNGFGVIYTAAYSACSRYNNLFMNPAFTAGHAMSAFTSQNYGAKEFDRIKSGLKVCLVIVFAAYIILGSVLYIFAEPLAGVFLDSKEAIALTVQYLRITSIGIIAVDVMFVFRNGVQAMEYPLVPMISGVLEMALRIGAIVVLSKTLGFKATAFAEVAAWSGALLLNMLSFFIYLSKEIHIKNLNNNIKFGC